MMNNQIEEIFISYRWSDKKDNATFEAFVRAIKESTGLNVFWDAESLRSGTFAAELRQRVACSYVFMPIVTESYLAFGAESNRVGDRDFCLLEYETALLNNVKIIPIFVGPEGDKNTVDSERVRQAATNTAKGLYDKSDFDLLKKHLLSQNGICLSSITGEALSSRGDELATLVFDQFCSSDKVSYFKTVLDTQTDRLNPVRIFGDFDDAGLTLENSYIPLVFQRHFTEAEKKEKEDKRENTAPVDLPETDLLATLGSDRYAVVVGDAGQGKSSYARRLAIELGNEAQYYGLSKNNYFPLYFECKNIDTKTLSKREDFLKELARHANISRAALDAILRHGRPLLIFDAMDEVAPNQMDRLAKAIYDHLANESSSVCCLFTSRPGQKLIAAGDMSLDHTDRTIVRRYTVKPFDEHQRNTFIDRLAIAKRINNSEKEDFLKKLKENEDRLADYQAVSRNPFVLMSVFTDYNAGEALPADRFDAICRVIDNIITRDLGKEQYESITAKDIKVILGAVSFELYCQRDEGKVPRAKAQMPVDFAEDLFGGSKRDEFHRFFATSELFDSSGFRHEFLASTYAAYYLLNIMERQKKDDNDPADADEMAWLSHDADYWKSVTEALLCLIDRTSRSSKVYLEPILDKLQEGASPDYDTLCSAVSQFTRHQARGALSLLAKMLNRGCKGILRGEETEDGFICKGVNPYEELFYYPAIYPALQPYLPNLPTIEEGDAAYLHNELRKEVCALFGDNAQNELRKLYEVRDAVPSESSLKLQKAAYRTRKHLEMDALTELCELLYEVRDMTTSEANLKLQEAAYRYKKPRGYVRVPKGVSSIEKMAFKSCHGLTAITLEESVTGIGALAFYDCRRLASIAISEKVTSIGRLALSGCIKLTSIIIPKDVTRIEEGAFAGCSNLTSLTVEKGNKVYHSDGNSIIHTATNTLVRGCASSKIPSYVTAIGEDAFSDCSELRSITLPEKVTSIGNETFCGCSGLTSITIPESVTSVGSRAFAGCSGLTSITIPRSVSNIEEGAFAGCCGLTSITIPESVTSIGSGAFAGCCGLTSITIPKDVTRIEEGAFAGCSNLTSLTVAKGNTVYHSDGNYIIHTATNTLVDGCAPTEIPSYIKAIGAEVFSGCSGLASITIPEGVTSIGSRAFAGCRELTAITIPRSVSNIEEGAFAGCHGLTSITLPEGITSIEGSVFESCSGLESVVVPEGVSSIGDGAFAHCSSLKDVYYHGTMAQWEAIKKMEGECFFPWDEGIGNYVVHCKDGDLGKKGEWPKIIKMEQLRRVLGF